MASQYAAYNIYRVSTPSCLLFDRITIASFSGFDFCDDDACSDCCNIDRSWFLVV